MGYYETAVWESDAEGPTLQDRMGGAYHPYVPDSLRELRLRLSTEATSACENAAAALAELDARARYTRTAESLYRMLLRSEAVSSSRIEGLEMPARRLLEVEALDELGVSHRLDPHEVEVLGNIRAMQEGVDHVSRSYSVALEDILAMHAELLRGSRLEAYGGVLRTSQNWIGGSWYTPLGAAYVPPRPERVSDLMSDVVDFMNDSPLSAVATAAVVHAQMETIHPFVDGNGRVGRALVHVVLRRFGACERTIAPVSLVLATDKARYIEALARYRFDAGDMSAAEARDANDAATCGWISFFAQALELSCHRALAFEESMAELRERWQGEVRPRAGSAASLLLDELPGNPVVSIASVARLTGRSYPAAREAVRALEKKGVLTLTSKNRKSGHYLANDVLDEFTRYERALATVSGDTRTERPGRPVPQRAGR